MQGQEQAQGLAKGRKDHQRQLIQAATPAPTCIRASGEPGRASRSGLLGPGLPDLPANLRSWHRRRERRMGARKRENSRGICVPAGMCGGVAEASNRDSPSLDMCVVGAAKMNKLDHLKAASSSF